jgi:cyclopropane fatty-acyl-phospholipid synthase-like methyltransferase
MNNPYLNDLLVDRYIKNEKPLSGDEFNFLTKYLSRDMLICEVGFGSGGLLNQLSENRFNNLNGYDLSPEFVRKAKKRFGDTIELFESDLTKKIKIRKKYNAVIAYHFFTAIQSEFEREYTIKNVESILVNNGILITKSFLSNNDKTIESVQEGIAIKIWIPNNNEFCKKIELFGFELIDSKEIEKEGFTQIINVFLKRKKI